MSSAVPPLAQQPKGGFGLYVHWPFCLSKCPYCDFNSHVRGQIDEAAWAAALSTELESLAQRLEVLPELETIFFGGGTPSLMPPEIAGFIIETAKTLLPVSDALEVTLEANPTSVEAERFQKFALAGVNRVSLGVQALSDEALQFLGRKHSAEEAIEAIFVAQSHFPRLSFDMIYARPDQTAEAWEDELKAAIALTADHLSLYQLTIEPETKFGALHAAGHLHPMADEQAVELYELTERITAEAGLALYEISNHAKPGAESRHNLIYWRGGAWLGIGPGAHGRLPTTAGGRIATASERQPEAWLKRVGAEGHGLIECAAVSAADQAREILLMGLRLKEGVDLDRIEAISPQTIDQTKLHELQDLGLVQEKQRRLTATPQGRAVLNRVISEILQE